MQSTHTPIRAIFVLFALLALRAGIHAADPGLIIPPTAEVSDQKAGSVLIYNVYTSGSTSAVFQNSRINITNTNATSTAFVHLFFVDGSACSVADSFLCLSANQTASFFASDVDPGVTGYLVAIAVDGVTGCPISFNHLIGDVYVFFATGLATNLGAEAFAALFPGKLNGCDDASTVATLAFNGVAGAGYNRIPRALAVSGIPDRGFDVETLLILNRIGGNLITGAATLGPIFGILFDDAETPYSFTFSSGACQFRSSLSNSFPRTTPRLNKIMPPGRSGWMKLFSQSDIGLLGAIASNIPGAIPEQTPAHGGHNLHKLTLTASTTLTIPVFPPSC